MANSSNAYITKQANSVDPSDWINKQEQIGQYYSELERKKEKDAFDQAEKDRLEYKADTAFTFDMSSMGNGHVDQALKPYLIKSVSDLHQANKEVEKALKTKGIRSKEYTSALEKFDNISARGKMFRLANDSVAQKLNDFQKLNDEGKIYMSKDNTDKLNTFSTTPIEIRENSKGQMMFFQGDKSYSPDQIGEQLDLGKAIYKVDEGSILEGITGSIGKKEYDEISGYTKDTHTNPWNDYTDGDGNKMRGMKSILAKGIDQALTDEVVESVLASEGEFGYDEMSPEVQQDLKSKIAEKWLEVGRGHLEEKFETSFDSAKYNAYNKNKGTDKAKDAEGLTFIEDKFDESGNYHTSRYSFKTPVKETGTNKSAVPSNYTDVIYDEHNGKVSVLGQKYTGNKNTPEFKAYEQAVLEESEAFLKYQGADSGSKEEEAFLKLYSSKTADKEIAQEALKTTKGEWVPDTVTDKGKVAQLLAKTLGVNSYKEIQDKLRREHEKKKKEDTSSELPDINELPDLP